MKYLIEYGNPDINMKRIRIEKFEDANKMFERLRKIAEKRCFTWVISMWGKDRFLIESITVNPTKIHRVN